MYLLEEMCETFYDEKNKIWNGPTIAELYGPEESIGTVALRKLLQDPDHISQICFPSDKKYTNLEIAQLSVSVAEHFRKMNVKQCDIIGLCASNTDYVAPLVFGAMLAGLTISTADYSFDKAELKHIFSNTKPTLMFCDGNIYDKVKESLEDINPNMPFYTMKYHINGVPTIDEFLVEGVDVTTYRPEPLKFGYNQTAAIVCSSGTTGSPKGVCISHTGLINGIAIVIAGTDLGSYLFWEYNSDMVPSDVVLFFSSLYWTSGFRSLVDGTIIGATRIISERHYSPDDFFEIVEKYKVSYIFTPPTSIAMNIASPKIKDCDLSSVVTYLSCGAAVPYSLVQKILPHLPNAKMIVGYGMTETATIISAAECSAKDSVGKLCQNMSAKVINNDGLHLGPNEVGEIWMKTIYPWAGYYNNERETKNTNICGWIRSGDLGYFDEKGNLFVVDRIKDLVRYNNFNFYPTEIEKVINHLPGVAEVCVCGIPDLGAGHLPAAAIVCIENSKLTKKQVYESVSSNMSDFNNLRGGVYFLESLPKTPSGKNLRRVVTETLEKLRKEESSGISI